MEDQSCSTDGKQVGSFGSWNEEFWKYSQGGIETRHEEAGKEKARGLYAQRGKTEGHNKRNALTICSMLF